MTCRLIRTNNESQLKRVKDYWGNKGKVLMNNFYRPKGDMCINCKNKERDCSLLDFKSMAPLSSEIVNGNFEITVKCTEYLKKD